jgi:hypothetical protein
MAAKSITDLVPDGDMARIAIMPSCKSAIARPSPRGGFGMPLGAKDARCAGIQTRASLLRSATAQARD